jgi:HD domain
VTSVRQSAVEVSTHTHLQLVPSARALAFHVLGADTERGRHSAGVAARASLLRGAVSDLEADLLVAAAWVHDIGYASALADTGFHPIDGARFLRSAGWDPLLCNLVAHHSGSRFLAARQGLSDELDEFAYEQDAVSDALTVADQTVGPHGQPMSLEERMREMLERRRPESPQARAHARRAAYFRAALQRVTGRLLVDG